MNSALIEIGLRLFFLKIPYLTADVSVILLNFRIPFEGIFSNIPDCKSKTIFHEFFSLKPIV